MELSSALIGFLKTFINATCVSGDSRDEYVTYDGTVPTSLSCAFREWVITQPPGTLPLLELPHYRSQDAGIIMALLSDILKQHMVRSTATANHGKITSVFKGFRLVKASISFYHRPSTAEEKGVWHSYKQ